MSAITVWSQPNCQPCKAVKRKLDKAGVAYEDANLLDHPERLAEFKEAGFTQSPVVESPYVETFSGFNPGLVDAIIAGALEG